MNDKRKRGPKPDPETGRHSSEHFTFRLDEGLKADLRREARECRRTLGKHIRFCLSARNVHTLAVEELGGTEAYAVLRSIAEVLNAAKGENEASWRNDPALFARAQKAVAVILDHFAFRAKLAEAAMNEENKR